MLNQTRTTAPLRPRTRPMKLFLKDPRRRRTHVMVFAITFVISTLLTAFFATQVVAGHTYEAKARENRLRPIVIPAPRGTILDRNNDVVATSITSYTLQVLPSDSSIILKTLQDLAPFVGLAGSDVERLMAQRNRRPHDLLEVTDRATYSQAAALEERRAAFPNIMVVERPQRYYPAGAAIGHIVGYVSEITRQQLRQSPYKDLGYRQGRLIGQTGIEKQYERTLSGRDGARCPGRRQSKQRRYAAGLRKARRHRCMQSVSVPRRTHVSGEVSFAPRRPARVDAPGPQDRSRTIDE